MKFAIILRLIFFVLLCVFRLARVRGSGKLLGFFGRGDGDAMRGRFEPAAERRVRDRWLLR